MFAAFKSFFRRQSAPYSIHDASLGIMREAQQRETIRALSNIIEDYDAREQARIRDSTDRDAELTEMLAMRGTGPWRMPGAVEAKEADDGEYPAVLREAGSLPFVAQGAYGDAELMLNNIEWKRETSLSWLEFTRWGIQQIILIARLRCLKDPMLKRGMKVSAQYVFGRGVEITSEDKNAAKILDEWRKRNKATLGHSALAETHRSKYYDGNIFWCCFTDSLGTGDVTMRTIDAVEIMDVITNPEDTSEPWYYKRDWVQMVMDEKTGARSNVHTQAWYPALNYEPTGAERLASIGGIPVMWDSPIYHRKCGDAPGKWHFGLPEVYAALEWGQAVRRFLQDCMTIRNSLAQFSMILQTKGGQQALQGIKTQLSTSVGPNASLWDQNPPAVAGAVFASGPGTTLQAFATKGAGGDPADVRMYKLMVCMVFGIPESFFADMNTSNLATATSLDRPTELNFREQQGVWGEDLAVLATYQLRKSKGAPSGRLREAMRAELGEAQVSEAPVPDVVVTFPAIIEADVPARVNSIVQATTFGSKLGQAVGIDERVAVGLLYSELGVENAQEVLEEQYPESEYDPDRTKVAAPSPVTPGSIPGVTGAPINPANPQAQVKETLSALRNAAARLSQAIRVWEAKASE